MSKMILIVDDDADDVDIFKEAINIVDSRIECISACNGQDGLKILQNNKLRKPDFIFLDLNMPRLNGKQFLKELRKQKLIDDIPVIIYSTSKLKEDIEETKKLGAVHYITKPTDLDGLCDCISFVLEHDWHEDLMLIAKAR